MKLSRWLFLGLAALALAAVPACNKGGSDKIKIAIVTNNPEEFWTYCEAGAKKAVQDLDKQGTHVELIFRKPEKGEVSVQMDIVNSLVKQDIKGIAVSVIDPTEQTKDLKRIAGQVKLIAMDNDAPNSNRICYVGTANYEAGKAVGRLVKEVMPNGGTVAIFVGQITGENAQLRRNGVLDELAGEKDAKGPQFGKYKLHKNTVITDNANREEAQNNALRELGALGDNPDVCMIGLWAYNPPTILAAAKAKSYKNVKIVGFDEDWNTLDGIERGEIAGTVVQDPYLFGYKSVEILAAEAKGDTSKRYKEGEGVPYRVVTRDGKVPSAETAQGLVVGDFRTQLKTLLDSAK